MSESTESGAMTEEPGASPQGPSAGTLLRQAREAAGLSISSLAGALKVPTDKLEALETDQWDKLPDPVFARALANSVCRLLKVDAGPILQSAPQAQAKPLPDRPGLNEPFRTPRDVAGEGWKAKLLRPGMVAVLALLVGSVVVALWPHAPANEPAPTPTPVAAVTPPPEVAGASGDAGFVNETVVPPAAAASAAAPSVMPAAPAAPAAPLVSTAPAPTPVPVTPAAPAPALVTPPATPPAAAVTPADPATTAAPTGGLLAFEATADSWVQVKDARGAVVLSRMLTAGQSASVSSGALPLSVVVGRATAVRVTVRGQVKDIKSTSRENVARFEVK